MKREAVTLFINPSHSILSLHLSGLTPGTFAVTVSSEHIRFCFIFS